jgi:uracil-DNA glycosylase
MTDSVSQQKLATVSQRLRQLHPNARYELNFETPLQLLIATILAAQCTDERVNRVTPALFARYPTARDFAKADLAELEELVKPTGFYRQKAKTIQNCCQALVDRFGGEVPRTMADMVTLPGVARKTANVVLTMAFGIPSGVIVDTHVARVSQRLGLTAQTQPERIEQDLLRGLAQSEWIAFGPALVLHGRYTCTAQDPACDGCPFEDLCPKIGVTMSKPAKKPAASKPAKPAAKKPAKAAPAKDPAAATPAQAAATGDLMGPEQLPASWRAVLAGEFRQPYFEQLRAFVDGERAKHKVFPPAEDVFNAFKHTPYDRVKVLILGQDPYHDDGQAHGLCFSVRPGVKPPPSLVNIFKELQNDLGVKPPNHGCLYHWADQGVMLLNTVLTVRAHSPNSHKGHGWEKFTDEVIRAISAKPELVVFVLWGAPAQKKLPLIDAARHKVVKSAHPSPLSAKSGFFGSKPFSQINAALGEAGRGEIDWKIPDL